MKIHTASPHVLGSLWLMERPSFRDMIARIESATPQAIEAAEAEVRACSGREPQLSLVGDVAIIQANGPITYRRSWLSMFFGGATIQDMQAQFQMALADPAVKTIAFKCHSPGGSVEMIPEFADQIFAARGQKPIISIADTAMCSSMYWLASQTDTIYVTNSSRVGSIGTVIEHEDISEMLKIQGSKITLIQHGDRKTDGNPYEPLSDQARATFQAYVDEVGLEFEAAVARGRGVSKQEVVDSFGQGDVFRGKKAIALGMADKLGTFPQVIARLTKGRGGLLASAVAVEVMADATPVEPAARATGAGSRQESGCQACSEACPCDEDECDEECPTCDPDCACSKAATAVKPKAEAPGESEAEAAARDEAAILAALI